MSNRGRKTGYGATIRTVATSHPAFIMENRDTGAEVARYSNPQDVRDHLAAFPNDKLRGVRS